MMDNVVVVKNLIRLDQVLDDLGRLLFKSYLAMPLTFNRADSQALLQRNNRLSFRYKSLKTKKAKLIHQLIPQVKDNVYLLTKLKRLDVLDKQQQVATQKSRDFKRQRKINRLKRLVADLQAERIEECTMITNQMLAFVYQSGAELFADYYKRNFDQVATPFESQPFKVALMELNYLAPLFTVAEIQAYVQFLCFKYTGQKINSVLYYDARAILPEAKETGFSAVAYQFELADQSWCYISYKGTEGSMEDPNIKSFNQRLDNYVHESYQDWKYNIDAMLIGNTDNDEQLHLAVEFTHRIIQAVYQIDPNTKICGLGHSLGGHFVQTLQLLDHPFDAGYTLNAAPVQLKQIKHYRPNLFSDEKWATLFYLTKQNSQSPDMAKLIKLELGQDFSEIENDWFIQDLTRIYFGFPSTFYLGTINYLSTKNLNYPFKVDISGYLDDYDLEVYSKFWDNLIQHVKRVETYNGSLMLASLVMYGLQSLREVYGAIKTDQTKKVFHDYAKYLCDAKIFNGSPVVVQANLERELSRPQTALKVLKNEWPFLSSVNHDMIDTVIFFHTIRGAKYLR